MQCMFKKDTYIPVLNLKKQNHIINEYGHYNQ